MALGVVAALFKSAMGYWQYLDATLQRETQALTWREQYQTLRAYYSNNGLYRALAQLLASYGLPDEELKSIRNPAYRIAEFYPANLWPGPLPRALPLQSDNPKVILAVQQIWGWSNWTNNKQTMARWLPIYGDCFIKVATNASDILPRPTQVFLENISPDTVVAIKTDNRGYLTYIRLDVPRTRLVNGSLQPYIYTEIWDKERQESRTADHTHAWGTPEEKLDEDVAWSRTPFALYGIDFVPFVWQPFRSIGDAAERGQSAITPIMDKIDEANRKATRLAQILFRYKRAVWALQANAVDKAGRPLPAPTLNADTLADVEDAQLDDNEILRIPGAGTLEPLVPKVDVGGYLEALAADLREIEADSPELAWYKLRELQDPSGRAMHNAMQDTRARLLEVRYNGEDAMVRAQMMAMTIGQKFGVFGAANVQGLDNNVGVYEAGELQHTFREREPFPPDDFEKAQTYSTLITANMDPFVAAKRAGYNDEDAEEIATTTKQREAEMQARQEALLKANQKQTDAGGQNNQGTPPDRSTGQQVREPAVPKPRGA